METVFFLSSKLVQWLIEPLNLVFLLTLVSLLFIYLRKEHIAKQILFGILVIYCLIGYAPSSESLARILEEAVPKADLSQIPQEQIAGMIILGGAIKGEYFPADRGEVWISDAAERVTKGVELIRKYPNLPFIFSGLSGKVSPTGMSEADAFKQLLAEQGLAEQTQATAFYENQSRNTYENAVYSKKIIQPLQDTNSPNFQEKKWILITSATHMYRSWLIFKKQDIPVITLPVDYRTTHSLKWTEFDLTEGAKLWNTILHEYVGILAYWLTGKL
jgi:uncharacterized SAM-binding protein YcdF (DUF218 family)